MSLHETIDQFESSKFLNLRGTAVLFMSYLSPNYLVCRPLLSLAHFTLQNKCLFNVYIAEYLSKSSIIVQFSSYGGERVHLTSVHNATFIAGRSRTSKTTDGGK